MRYVSNTFESNSYYSPVMSYNLHGNVWFSFERKTAFLYGTITLLKLNDGFV